MTETRRNHMLKSLKEKVRFDGRDFEEIRDISVESGVSKNAEGSARVKIGETEVIAGVKLSVEKPYPDTPEKGTIMVGAELLAMSSPNFEVGPPSIWAIEIARVVDRGIREGKAIDLKKLCIEAGEKAWIVSIDVVTINDAGNLLDASGIATIVALKDAKFPEYDGKAVNYKELTKKSIPLDKIPIPVTVVKIDEAFLIDTTSEEEEFIDARLTVTTIENGDICAMQKGGQGPLNSNEIKQMIQLAKKKAKEIREKL